MANINLRNIDPDLIRRFKAYAAAQGRTMTGLIVEYMAKLVGA